MKTQKAIALHFLLLLWAGLLCLSGYLQAEQPKPDRVGVHPTLDTSAEALTTGNQAFPVAWSEPSAPHPSTTPVDPVLPLQPHVYGLQAKLADQLNQKPFRTLFGSSSLTEQYRILPNAP